MYFLVTLVKHDPFNSFDCTHLPRLSSHNYDLLCCVVHSYGCVVCCVTVGWLPCVVYIHSAVLYAVSRLADCCVLCADHDDDVVAAVNSLMDSWCRSKSPAYNSWIKYVIRTHGHTHRSTYLYIILSWHVTAFVRSAHVFACSCVRSLFGRVLFVRVLFPHCSRCVVI